jgi:hypothetical protein
MRLQNRLHLQLWTGCIKRHYFRNRIFPADKELEKKWMEKVGTGSLHPQLYSFNNEQEFIAIKDFLYDSLLLPLKPDCLPLPISSELQKIVHKWIDRIPLNDQIIPSQDRMMIDAMIRTFTVSSAQAYLEDIISKHGKIHPKIWDIVFQNVLFTHGIPAANRLKYIYKSKYQFQTMNTDLLLCLGAAQVDDLVQYEYYFTKLRKTWWPIPKYCIKLLFGSLFDLIERHNRCYRNKLPSTVSPAKVMEYQNRLLKKYIHVEGFIIDKDFHQLLVFGNARCGMLKNALYRYHDFLESGHKPNQALLDVLFQCICFSLSRKTEISNPFTGNNVSDIVAFIFKEYSKYELQPRPELFHYMVHELDANKITVEQDISTRIKTLQQDPKYSSKPAKFSKGSRLKVLDRLLQVPLKNRLLTRASFYI